MKALFLIGVLACFGAMPLRAHRLDEYLQATIVAIEPEGIRLQIQLTPGVAVAEEVLAQIDRDRDGLIAPAEAAAYGEALTRDLTVRLDGQALASKLSRSFFPQPGELRGGLGIIQIEYAVAIEALVAGPHRLTLENRHLKKISAFLLNAAKPRAPTIQITRQQRQEDQSSGEIDFTFSGTAG